MRAAVDEADDVSQPLACAIDDRHADQIGAIVLVFLERRPLSTTGKLDRRALPKPTRERPKLDQAFVAPRTPLEKDLVEIWAALLDLETVGIHDNFLDLGGHSLLAAQITSRVRDAFDVELTLREFFEAPTVAGLAECVAAAGGAGRAPQADAIVPVARASQLPLSFAQERMWFIEQLEPHSPIHNIPMAFRLKGPLNVPVLERSLNDVVKRHEVLRSSFGAIGGQPVQVLSAVATVKPTVADLRDQPDPARQADTLLAKEMRRPFALAQGPLLRATLLRVADHEWVLLLVTPGGFEGFVATLSQPAAALPRGGPPDPGPMVALAAEYHVEILGPLPR